MPCPSHTRSRSAPGAIARYCPHWIKALIVTLVLTPTPSFSSPTISATPWRWSGVERIVVIPDIHGAYPAFVELLQATGVVNTSLRWTGGATHLVSLGDLLDRGAESRKVMDLLIRLQAEAPDRGGQVHVVAGNHETMNLLGDLRYVSPAEFAKFVDTETPEQRKQAYDDFLARRSEAVALSFLGGGVLAVERNPETRAEFEQLFPRGYFGHRSGLSPEGVYGSWLMSLPALIVVNDTVFVHGGLPPVTATAPIEELNRRYHADLRLFFELYHRLIETGLLTYDSAELNFQEARKVLRIADPSSCPREERAACKRERGSAPDSQRNLTRENITDLRKLVELENSPMFGPTGPQWYRGSVRCKDALEMPLLKAALANLGASRVVVGHTPTTDRRVHQLRDDRLIMLDTGMLVSSYHGRPAALIMEGDRLEVQYLAPLERTQPLGKGGNGVYPLGDRELHEALISGEIIRADKGWFGTQWQISMAYNGVNIDATFFPAGDASTDKLELAAYRIDQLLGFDLVPTTVSRVINGQPGTLQLAYPNFLTESQRLRQSTPDSNWCPLPQQLDLLALFDYLIGQGERSKSSFGYTQPLWDLKASSHDEAFEAFLRMPEALAEYARQLPLNLRAALASLNQTTLSQTLGQQLDEKQIANLLARRNALLAILPDQEASYDQSGTAAMDDTRR